MPTRPRLKGEPLVFDVNLKDSLWLTDASDWDENKDAYEHMKAAIDGGALEESGDTLIVDTSPSEAENYRSGRVTMRYDAECDVIIVSVEFNAGNEDIDRNDWSDMTSGYFDSVTDNLGSDEDLEDFKEFIENYSGFMDSPHVIVQETIVVKPSDRAQFKKVMSKIDALETLLQKKEAENPFEDNMAEMARWWWEQRIETRYFAGKPFKEASALNSDGRKFTISASGKTARFSISTGWGKETYADVAKNGKPKSEWLRDAGLATYMKLQAGLREAKSQRRKPPAPPKSR